MNTMNNYYPESFNVVTYDNEEETEIISNLTDIQKSILVRILEKHHIKYDVCSVDNTESYSTKEAAIKAIKDEVLNGIIKDCK